MRKDKERAIQLRREGASYSQICGTLKIPKTTVSDWFRDLDWSINLKQKLSVENQEAHKIRLIELNKIRGESLNAAYNKAREEARCEFESMKYNPLFIAGLMLYWGEGDKLTKFSTKITNTDPELIRLYVFFLRNACGIPEQLIKGHILVYPDLDALTCKKHWAAESGIREDRFFKTTVIQGKHKARRIKYGVCMVGISSTYFKVKMLEWLKLLPEELMDKQYYAKIGRSAVMV